MTDHAQALEGALINPKPEPPSFLKRTTSFTTTPTMTASANSWVDDIAQKIVHAEFIDMLEWMTEVHSQVEALHQAKAMHDWALRRLEKKTSV